MSITFPSAYTAAVSAPNAVTDWLLKIKPGDDSINLSSRDISLGSGDLYHGLVADWGSIKESIDLKKMKLKTSDMTLKVIDSWHNATGQLSAELFSPSAPHYLNSQICIYGWSPGIDAEDLPTLFQGYLREIGIDDGYITLSIEARKQWDLQVAPNVQIADGTYVPLIMGAYSMPNSTAASPQLCSTDPTSVWAAPVLEVANDNIRALLHEDAGEHSGEWKAGILQKSFNLVYPVAETDAGSTFDENKHPFESVDGTQYYCGQAALVLRHAFLSSQLREQEDNEFDDFENIGETGSSYATKRIGGNGVTGGNTYSAIGAVVKPNWFWRDYTDNPWFHIKVRIEEVIGNTWDVGHWKLRVYAKVSGASFYTLVDIDPHTTDFPYEETFIYYNAATDQNDIGTLEFECRCQDIDSVMQEVLSYDFKLNQHQCEYQVQNTETTGTEDELKNANNVKQLFFGADGLVASYTDGSGTVRRAHEMLREILNRYAGIDHEDDDITNWDALDGDRPLPNWECRLQEYKPKPLQHYVDTLQLHGGFIWQEQDNTARVIYVKDSYSAGDVDHALTGSDIDALSVDATPLSDIVSETTYKYKKSPITGEFLAEYIKTNDNRANWGYATGENSQKIELDYFVAPLQLEISALYDNIYGEPKLLVSGKLYHPKWQVFEVGDIVTFSDMPYDPFGFSWSGTYFIVTKIQRRQDSITFTAREVG